MKEKEKRAQILDFKLMLLWSAWVISLSLICASGSQQRVITHFQTVPEVAAGAPANCSTADSLERALNPSLLSSQLSCKIMMALIYSFCTAEAENDLQIEGW